MMKSMPKALSCDYYWVESVVDTYVEQWRRAGFGSVVAIARGGLAPGLMAASLLDIPLYALSYERTDRRASWFTSAIPESDSKVLLVEDIAGRGTTLLDCVSFLKDEGVDFEVFTLAYDDESRIIPDYGMKMPTSMRAWFPWEREAITPAFAATENKPDRPEYEYASWAIDLDGILLPDIPDHLYVHDLKAALTQRDGLLPSESLPGRDLRNLTIITGRPEEDRERTQTWLTRHGFTGPLIMRDPARFSAGQTAIHKAEAIVAGYHTHFIESDSAQALEIAHRVKVARVIWWNGTRAMVVYANQVSDLATL